MAALASNLLPLATSLLLVLLISPSKAELDPHYYDQTCPQAEKIILEMVRNASVHDPKVPARILRMFFHDCFIRVCNSSLSTQTKGMDDVMCLIGGQCRRCSMICDFHLGYLLKQGCDASILLDSTPGNQAEKDGPPNISVRSFYVIDDAKDQLEMACPHMVSCADIIAIAARDVVAMSGGPSWNVQKGRKDGRASRANDTINLPAPTFNVTQLIQSFAKRGLGVKDLVALSGGHTLGFSHCSSFEARLRNFSSVHDIDPSMNTQFAENLKKKCPKPNKDHNAGEFLDSTSSTFDNDYYKRVMEGKSVFGSDQALLSDYRTRWIVESFARDQSLFCREFAASMVKLGNVGVIENGEVRVKCRVVN